MKTVICIGGLCCTGKSRFIATNYPKCKVVDIYDLHRDYPDETNDWYWWRFMDRIDKALCSRNQIVAEAIWTDKQIARVWSYCAHMRWKLELYWIPVNRKVAMARAIRDYQEHLDDPEYTRYHVARLRIINDCPVSHNPRLVILWDWNKGATE